jgi:hypothetical protein
MEILTMNILEGKLATPLPDLYILKEPHSALKRFNPSFEDDNTLLASYECIQESD